LASERFNYPDRFEESELVECSNCGRKFAEDRI